MSTELATVTKTGTLADQLAALGFQLAPNQLDAVQSNPDLVRSILAVGQIANAEFLTKIMEDFRSRKSTATLKAHDCDLGLFAQFWNEFAAQVTPDQRVERDPATLATVPGAWFGITSGLVSLFVIWLHDHGYAVKSINRAVSTVRTYAKMAISTGQVSDPAEYMRIDLVKGYSEGEGVKVDEKRDRTRRGTKKETPTTIPADKIDSLKLDHPRTSQGRRDRLMICLLADHGLRCSDVARLRVGDLDRSSGRLTVKIKKTGTTIRHKLTKDTAAALGAWIDKGDCYTDPGAPLLRPTSKSGSLAETGDAKGLTTRAIMDRVRKIGEDRGVYRLSPHDFRHNLATRLAESGYTEEQLRAVFGWANGSATPSTYVHLTDYLTVDVDA